MKDWTCTAADNNKRNQVKGDFTVQQESGESCCNSILAKS